MQANPVNAIPHGQPGGEFFTAYRRGELTQDEWFVYESVRLADHAVQHAVLGIPPLKDALRIYCARRVDRAIEYDPHMARTLGAWFRNASETALHNQDEADLFRWAIEKLTPHKLENHIEKLKRAIERFEALPVPHEDMAMALKCKEADVYAREQGRRG